MYNVDQHFTTHLILINEPQFKANGQTNDSIILVVATNQEKMADSDGVAVLARLISVTNDVELSSVIKYILQICLNLGNTLTH